MFQKWKNLFAPPQAYIPPQANDALEKKLESSLLERLIDVRAMFPDSGDLVIHELEVCGVPCAMLMCEGMVSTATFSKIFALPLTTVKLENPSPQAVFEWVRRQSLMAPDQKEIHTYAELFRFMMSGFVVLLIDGIEAGSVFGIQGFSGRSVGEPTSEVNVRGSQEGFIEMLRPNMSLLRRRIKSPDLIFDMFELGTKSRTDCMLVYLKDMVSPALLREVKYRLSKVKIDVVLETGYIQPFLDDKPLSLFSGVGYTERPDTLCAKVAEGRIGILMDGTPYALIVPYLFNENFQSADDYSHRPYFATFIRWLKYAAFFFSILLPGLYVGVGTFHPELLPDTLLMSLVASEESTPFPLMIEALVIFFIYEIMREAGLRMPRAVGHAVSIVGALVIGDAAVTAGIIGSPMVMVVAITAISSFVVPSLYEPVTILRFAFILIGGLTGLFGIALGMCAVLVNLCAVNPLGVPATAPATPFSLYSMRDVLFRWSWRTLAREDLRVQDLAGSDIRDDKAKEE
ncbi:MULTISPECIES: spore germination protein [Anaerotruncus]|uniref:spore germination protein n=1 Tax=Anaerotruncus TaxID=244127 RepID=UPI0008331D18|nr:MULTISPECIES: spore germination protein [Anaerotruncus]RGX56689.1 spore germination protein [Anaerotruncus sp. AF02-27]